MIEINIKKEIGRRIYESRKAKGLTLKELGTIAGNFKQTRLTNWEQGIRAPGPEEIKQLALALEVSPAFLMCLSDDKNSNQTKNHSQLIPLLDRYQACNAKSYTSIARVEKDSNDMLFVSVSRTLLKDLSSTAFAIKMSDDSMMPEIRANDVLVIDPMILPEPGDYVGVNIEGKRQLIICQFKKLSYTSSEFELLTLNDNWPNIKLSESVKIEIIGRVMQNLRLY